MSNSSIIETKNHIFRQNLTIGKGSIDPAVKVANGEFLWGLVDSLENDLIYDHWLYEHLDFDIPIQCADGRTNWIIGGSAIGGTTSVVIADALGGRKYYNDEINAKEHAKLVFDFLISKGFTIGGHIDDQAKNPNCGCGGEDRLCSTDSGVVSILGFLSDNGDHVRHFLEGLRNSISGKNLGIKISDEQHSLIINNAKELKKRSSRNSAYSTGGVDFSEAMEDKNAKIETLHGQHAEVALVIDLRQGIALNRAEIMSRYGNHLQAFYLNIASLQFAADQMHEDEQDKDLAFKSSL